MKLVTKSKIENYIPKNEYCFTVCSNDGEYAYTNKHYYELDNNMLNVFKLMYSIFTDLTMEEGHDAEILFEHIEKKGKDFGFEDCAFYVYCETIGFDPEEDEFIRILDSMKFSFFDENGDEFQVEVHDDNDNPLAMCRVIEGIDEPVN